MSIPGRKPAPAITPHSEAEPSFGTAAYTELSLWDFIDPLRLSWRLIVAVALGFGAIAFVATFLQRPVYEATAIVRIAESKTGDEVEAVRPEKFRPLLENRAIAAEVIRELGLVQESRWSVISSARPVAPDGFLRGYVTVEQVTGTNLLRVNVRQSDAGRAATVANELVERGLALNRRINQQEVVDARDYIKTQLDEAAKRVETLKGELLALKQQTQVDALRADTEGALAVRAQLLDLHSAIEYERAFLAASERELQASEQLLTTRRSIDRVPALMEAARQQGASVLGLELSEQQVSAAYSKLQEQINESRAKLAGLERERRMLIEDRRIGRAELPTLSKLYTSEIEISRLEAEYELALKVYEDLSIRHEDARIRVGSRGAQLQLVDPAVPPTTRISPRVVRTTQLALLLGALVGSLIALGRYFLTRHQLEA